MSDENNNPNNEQKEKVIDVDFQKATKKIQRIVPTIGIILVLVLAVMNSFYTINSGENGVVLRLGKVSSVEERAGLHIKAPFIDEVYPVNVEEIHNMEYGFATSVAGTEGRSAVYEERNEEAQVIVDGDNDNASIALIELIINYKVVDPEAYLFHVSELEGTIRLALEDAVRSSVQTLTIDQAKTDKDLINNPTREILQKKLNDYEAGIRITKVATQNVNFLESVEAIYQEKENANQYRKAREEDAEKYKNTEIPSANAEAERMIKEAEIYKVQTIANAKAGIAEYNALYEEYKNNKAIVKERYYVDAMKQFVENNKVVVDAMGDSDIYKFYNIDDEENVKKEVVTP